MKYVRDGLYGYIAVTQIEDALLKHPAVLRLHKILQNSTLYHTYPFNRGSRFPHSLGTMHIVGKLYRALITNSNSGDIKNLIEATTRIIERYNRRELIIESNQYLLDMQSENNPEGNKKDDFFFKNGWIVTKKVIEQENPLKLSDNYVLNILLQAMRLAAIVHDLGHPPYSHVVEFSLEELEKRSKKVANSKFYDDTQNLIKAYKNIIDKNTIFTKKLFKNPGRLHEKLGLVLIDHLYNQPKGIQEKYKQIVGFTSFFNISFAVSVTLIATEQYEHYAQELFNSGLSEIPDFGYLYPLANIISGPVDCDRLDYLLRDATNSGTPDFLSFDQDRIINNINLTKLEKGTTVGKSSETGKELKLPNEMYVPSFDRRAFSALADFFYTRYRQFRWLISHHNVVRTDHSMFRLVLELTTISGNFTEEVNLLPEGKIETDIKNIVDAHQISKILDLSNPSQTLRYIDDPWLDNCLQGILYDLQQLPIETLSIQAKRIKKYLELIIERNTDLMPAIWKNEDRFRFFANGFNGWLINIDGSEIEKIYSPRFKNLLNEARKEAAANPNPTRATNMILKYWWSLAEKPRIPYSVMIPVEEELKNGGKNIQFALKVFTPYERVLIVPQTGNPIPLEEMSNIVYKLEDIALEGLMLYGFDFSEPVNKWEEPDITKLGSDVSTIIITKLLELDAGYKSNAEKD